MPNQHGDIVEAGLAPPSSRLGANMYGRSTAAPRLARAKKFVHLVGFTPTLSYDSSSICSFDGETAREFIQQGARVAITGKSSASLESARKVLGPDVLVTESDASDAAAQPAVAATLKEKFGGLDAAVINAGIADLRPIDKWDAAGFDRTFNINVKGPFF